MNIRISNGSFIPKIDQFPMGVNDILVALENTKMTIGIVKEIGNAIISLAKELGIISHCRVDELGVRAIQAMHKNICPKDFSTTEEWVNRIIQDDGGYEPNISASMLLEEKMYIGIAIVAAVLIEKYKQIPMKDFILLFSTNPGLFTVDRMNEIAKMIISGNIMFENIVRYLSGQDNSHEMIAKVTDTLVELEKSIDPMIDDNEAYNRIIEYSKM